MDSREPIPQMNSARVAQPTRILASLEGARVPASKRRSPAPPPAISDGEKSLFLSPKFIVPVAVLLVAAGVAGWFFWPAHVDSSSRLVSNANEAASTSRIVYETVQGTGHHAEITENSRVTLVVNNADKNSSSKPSDQASNDEKQRRLTVTRAHDEREENARRERSVKASEHSKEFSQVFGGQGNPVSQAPAPAVAAPMAAVPATTALAPTSAPASGVKPIPEPQTFATVDTSIDPGPKVQFIDPDVAVANGKAAAAKQRAEAAQKLAASPAHGANAMPPQPLVSNPAAVEPKSAVPAVPPSQDPDRIMLVGVLQALYTSQNETISQKLDRCSTLSPASERNVCRRQVCRNLWGKTPECPADHKIHVRKKPDAPMAG